MNLFFKIFAYLFLFLFAGLKSYGQILDSVALADEPVFTDILEAAKEPNKVYKLNLRKNKLKEIPKEVFTFTNLQELNLGRNKITVIPADIGKFIYLEVLDISANNIDSLPNEIGNLSNIKKLILNQNVISVLPSTIGKLTKMTFLDLWGNEIQELPEEISNLKNTLKILDLRVISIKDEMQEDMEKQLPNTKIYFSTSCNCH